MNEYIEIAVGLFVFTFKAIVLSKAIGFGIVAGTNGLSWNKTYKCSECKHETSNFPD